MNDETVEQRFERHLAETDDGAVRRRRGSGPELIDERFELLSELGRGGMGRVYRAFDRSARREVALKVLSAEDLSPDQRERFQREGEITASLDHPGIVRVHTMGLTRSGRPFLVYELVEGRQTLGEVLPQVELSERLRLIRDTAAALGHAHRAGVVHRDVKPGNVLVDREGRVRVADFGLAAARNLDRLTRSGTLLGTVSYMSPEQVRGEPPSAGTDVWALGVILYEALTGERPFKGEFADLILAIRRADPEPPRGLEPGVSAPLSALCLRCLSASSSDRPVDGTALAAELDVVLSGERRRASGWIPAAAVSALAIGLSALLLNLPEAPPTALLSGEGPPPAARGSQQARGPQRRPEWFEVLSPAERPRLPLPEGLGFGERHGEYVNARDGSVLVYVPADRFLIGHDAGSLVTERPARWVTLPGFFVGKYEVTNAEYQRFCDATGREPPALSLPGGGSRSSAPRIPVVGVTWHEARAYCAWAGLRLPNEAEWEAAARGSDGRLWPWGNAEPGRGDRGNFGTPAPTLDPVGSHPDGASPFGACDMAGNADEWVDPGPAHEDVLLPTGSAPRRGGSLANTAELCKSYRRSGSSKEARALSIGFRAARSAAPPFPGWWSESKRERRPPLPLPKGLAFGERPGDYVNERDGSVLVYVPADRFLIGHDEGNIEERPAHWVSLPGFFVGKYEVTNEQYERFCASTDRSPPPLTFEGGGIRSAAPRVPVVAITWHEARAYCAWAGLRLPSELEWEAAARGSDGRLWPWGDEPGEGDRGNFGNSTSGLQPIGSYPSGVSPCGAHDMAGNAIEWIDESPTHAPSPEGSDRLLPGGENAPKRGGSLVSRADHCKSFRRSGGNKQNRSLLTGFRVACSAPPPLPGWWASLPPERRPTLPLPDGLAFGEGAGEYLNERDGSVLVYVPAGEYRIGRDGGPTDEGPEHAVNLPGYFIGKYELTSARFARFCAETGRTRATPQPSELPAGDVSWPDAAAYCAWAGLRLPSEAEWEAAARGADGRLWPWGNEPPSDRRALANVRAPQGGVRPVGSYPRGASPFGCLDMSGNVAEWTADSPRPYSSAGIPEGVFLSSGRLRIVRGGSWLLRASGCTTFNRKGLPRETRAASIGFRVARSAR